MNLATLAGCPLSLLYDKRDKAPENPCDPECRRKQVSNMHGWIPLRGKCTLLLLLFFSFFLVSMRVHVWTWVRWRWLSCQGSDSMEQVIFEVFNLVWGATVTCIRGNSPSAQPCCSSINTLPYISLKTLDMFWLEIHTYSYSFIWIYFVLDKSCILDTCFVYIPLFLFLVGLLFDLLVRILNHFFKTVCGFVDTFTHENKSGIWLKKKTLIKS